MKELNQGVKMLSHEFFRRNPLGLIFTLFSVFLLIHCSGGSQQGDVSDEITEEQIVEDILTPIVDEATTPATTPGTTTEKTTETTDQTKAGDTVTETKTETDVPETETIIKPTITGGRDHTCGLKSNGAVYCWGRNNYGQLGNGKKTDSSTPVPVSGLAGSSDATKATALSAGKDFTCAIMKNETVRCWGRNGSGQIGNGVEVLSSNKYISTPESVLGITTAISIGLGSEHGCAVMQGGSVKCWGLAEAGQLGNGTDEEEFFSTPIDVNGFETDDVATKVVAGEEHSCALLDDGTIRCWGESSYGILGDNEETKDYTLASVHVIDASSDANRAVDISSSGGQHTCALMADETVKCWGGGDNGESAAIGIGDHVEAKVPTHVSGIAAATKISAGYNHTCALLKDGTVLCWGSTDDGQIGDGKGKRDDPIYLPKEILSADSAFSVSDVFATYNKTYALSENGTAKCWGKTTYGECGENSATSAAYPTVLEGKDGAVLLKQVAVSVDTSCGVFEGGTAKCWGYNGSGQPGYGTTNNSSTPVAVVGGEAATKIATWGYKGVASGEGHTCILMEDGLIKCLGSNNFGQLGSGDKTDSSTLVPVEDIVSASDVGVGKSHSCARMTDDTVKCWGRNNFGQLGIGVMSEMTTAEDVQVIIETKNAIQLSVNNNTTCAVMGDGTIRCWGYNGEGQLGTGDTSKRNTPDTNVSGITTATKVAVGYSHTCALMDNGSVSCWGSNIKGELGDGSTSQSLIPVAVHEIDGDGPDKSATDISAGKNFSCAIIQDRTVKCWGLNDVRQLGIGTSINEKLPVLTRYFMDRFSGETSIHAGGEYVCFHMPNSRSHCWGQNEFGQIGIGKPVIGEGIPVAADYYTPQVMVNFGANEPQVQ